MHKTSEWIWEPTELKIFNQATTSFPGAPRSPQGAVRWETLGTRLIKRYAISLKLDLFVNQRLLMHYSSCRTLFVFLSEYSPSHFDVIFWFHEIACVLFKKSSEKLQMLDLLARPSECSSNFFFWEVSICKLSDKTLSLKRLTLSANVLAGTLSKKKMLALLVCSHQLRQVYYYTAFTCSFIV